MTAIPLWTKGDAMLLINKSAGNAASGEFASEWVRVDGEANGQGSRWICCAAEAPVNWMLGKEAGAVKARLVCDGIEYRLVRNGSLVGMLAEILSGAGNGGPGVPQPVHGRHVAGVQQAFRDEFGLDLPVAWHTVMHWCDGFLIGNVEVFGARGRTREGDVYQPRGIIEANRSLRESVSSRVLWLGAMVGVSLGIDLDSGLCVGVTDCDRTVWMATRTPAELLAWLFGLVTVREVAFLDPVQEADWPSHVADLRARPVESLPEPRTTRYPGRAGEQHRYGL